MSIFQMISSPTRSDGFLPLSDYAALGDGRSVALSGSDGSIDWWCVPNMDSPPLFDRLLSKEGGHFTIQPVGPFRVEQSYLPDSNVLCTLFHTETGVARLTESLNSTLAGRLPWAELARRVEGIQGSVEFRFSVLFGRQDDTVNPYQSTIGQYSVFHVGSILGIFLHSPNISCVRKDEGIEGSFKIHQGERNLLAIIAGDNEPLVVSSLNDIDARIDVSDEAWRRWSDGITYAGKYRHSFVRSALALKLLLFSPSGAIAAAATTSLPEKIGGSKNYDYRFAWVRAGGIEEPLIDVLGQ